VTWLVVTTLVDCAAVLALAWLAARGARAHALMWAEQQAALARLRGELADLVADAERRAQDLDQALAAREARLRALVDATARTAGTPSRAPGVDDAAEARLRRDVARVLAAEAGAA
jgi:hypothetical protein